MCHSQNKVVLSSLNQGAESQLKLVILQHFRNCYRNATSFSHSNKSQGCDFTFFKQAKSICKQWMLSLPEDCRTQGFNIEEINLDYCPKYINLMAAISRDAPLQLNVQSSLGSFH